MKTSINNEKTVNIFLCFCEGWNDIMIFVNAINGPLTKQKIDFKYDIKVYVRMSAE